METVLRSVWAYLLKPLWREKKAQVPRTSRLEEPCVSEFVLDSIVREGKALESASRSAASSKGKSLYPDVSSYRCGSDIDSRPVCMHVFGRTIQGPPGRDTRSWGSAACRCRHCLRASGRSSPSSGPMCSAATTR